MAQQSSHLRNRTQQIGFFVVVVFFLLFIVLDLFCFDEICVGKKQPAYGCAIRKQNNCRLNWLCERFVWFFQFPFARCHPRGLISHFTLTEPVCDISAGRRLVRPQFFALNINGMKFNLTDDVMRERDMVRSKQKRTHTYTNVDMKNAQKPLAHIRHSVGRTKPNEFMH